MSACLSNTGYLQLAIPFLFLRVLIAAKAVDGIQTAKIRQCVLKSAEFCFERLFENMPICSESEMVFQCHHFKVLDGCFREHKTICSPDTIGHIAKASYRHRLVVCAKQAQKKYRDAPTYLKGSSTILRQHPPSELQFISLFGYLQTQCTSEPSANCSNDNFKHMTASCEADIRQRSNFINSDFDRHQLLRLKLDTSSRLLPYAETRRTEECLIVRSALTSIFEIHKKYCLQSAVTRCMCERLNFEYFCNIECANIELFDLPFDQKLAWTDFKGQLTGSSTAKGQEVSMTLSVLLLHFLLIRIF